MPLILSSAIYPLWLQYGLPGPRGPVIRDRGLNAAAADTTMGGCAKNMANHATACRPLSG
jgi:hypothetical protein